MLDATYVPLPGIETTNFEVMKEFVYAVFLSKIRFSEASLVVRKNKDAQICYQMLYNRFQNSEETRLDLGQLRRKLNQLSLDSSWKGTTSKFLTMFDTVVSQIEDLNTNEAMEMSDDLKLSLIIEAVSKNESLAAIASIERQLAQAGTHGHTYEQYLRLLQVRAKELDSVKATDTSGRQRVVNAADRADGKSNRQRKKDKKKSPGKDGNDRNKGGNSGTKKNDKADGDRAVSYIQPELFNQLPADIKALIHNAGKKKSAADATPSAPVGNAPATTSRTVNHAMVSPAPSGIEGHIQAAILAGTPSQADIRNVLSGSSTENTAGQFIVQDNQVFVSLNMARQYQVAQTTRDDNIGMSLMDGGSNGGLAGDDLLILETHHDADRVNVVGIAGNQLESLPRRCPDR